MKLTGAEIDILSAWAREEWEADCYQRPAHRLQLAHGVSGGLLIAFIKAWTKAENKKDQEILRASDAIEPTWPWATADEFRGRLEEIQCLQAVGRRQTATATPTQPTERAAAGSEFSTTGSLVAQTIKGSRTGAAAMNRLLSQPAKQPAKDIDSSRWSIVLLPDRPNGLALLERDHDALVVAFPDLCIVGVLRRRNMHRTVSRAAENTFNLLFAHARFD